MTTLESSADFGQTTIVTTSACDTLVHNIFQPHRPSNSTVVAFTSVNSGEGVTHVISALARAMRGSSPAGMLNVDMDWLKSQPAKPSLTDLLELKGRAGWVSGWEQRKQIVQQLRGRSQYVVIDCPALSASSDCISLAPLVDGIVLVVEADRTKKSQIANAQCRIEAAGGKILGLVLNKRRYPVPDSIYNRL